MADATQLLAEPFDLHYDGEEDGADESEQAAAKEQHLAALRRTDVAYLDIIEPSTSQVTISYGLKVGRNIIGRNSNNPVTGDEMALSADPDEHHIFINRPSISHQHAEVIIQEYEPQSGDDNDDTSSSNLHQLRVESLSVTLDLSSIQVLDLKSTNKTHLSDSLTTLGIRCPPRIPKLLKHEQFLTIGEFKSQFRIRGMRGENLIVKEVEEDAAGDSTQAYGLQEDNATLPYEGQANDANEAAASPRSPAASPAAPKAAVAAAAAIQPTLGERTLAYHGEDDLYGSAGGSGLDRDDSEARSGSAPRPNPPTKSSAPHSETDANDTQAYADAVGGAPTQAYGDAPAGAATQAYSDDAPTSGHAPAAGAGAGNATQAFPAAMSEDQDHADPVAAAGAPTQAYEGAGETEATLAYPASPDFSPSPQLNATPQATPQRKRSKAAVAKTPIDEDEDLDATMAIEPTPVKATPAKGAEAQHETTATLAYPQDEDEKMSAGEDNEEDEKKPLQPSLPPSTSNPAARLSSVPRRVPSPDIDETMAEEDQGPGDSHCSPPPQSMDGAGTFSLPSISFAASLASPMKTPQKPSQPDTPSKAGRVSQPPQQNASADTASLPSSHGTLSVGTHGGAAAVAASADHSSRSTVSSLGTKKSSSSSSHQPRHNVAAASAATPHRSTSNQPAGSAPHITAPAKNTSTPNSATLTVTPPSVPPPQIDEAPSLDLELSLESEGSKEEVEDKPTPVGAAPVIAAVAPSRSASQLSTKSDATAASHTSTTAAAAGGMPAWNRRKHADSSADVSSSPAATPAASSNREPSPTSAAASSSTSKVNRPLTAQELKQQKFAAKAAEKARKDAERAAKLKENIATPPPPKPVTVAQVEDEDMNDESNAAAAAAVPSSPVAEISTRRSSRSARTAAAAASKKVDEEEKKAEPEVEAPVTPSSISSKKKQKSTKEKIASPHKPIATTIATTTAPPAVEEPQFESTLDREKQEEWNALKTNSGSSNKSTSRTTRKHTKEEVVPLVANHSPKSESSSASRTKSSAASRRRAGRSTQVDDEVSEANQPASKAPSPTTSASSKPAAAVPEEDLAATEIQFEDEDITPKSTKRNGRNKASTATPAAAGKPSTPPAKVAIESQISTTSSGATKKKSNSKKSKAADDETQPMEIDQTPVTAAAAATATAAPIATSASAVVPVESEPTPPRRGRNASADDSKVGSEAQDSVPSVEPVSTTASSTTSATATKPAKKSSRKRGVPKEEEKVKKETVKEEEEEEEEKKNEEEKDEDTKVKVEAPIEPPTKRTKRGKAAVPTAAVEEKVGEPTPAAASSSTRTTRRGGASPAPTPTPSSSSSTAAAAAASKSTRQKRKITMEEEVEEDDVKVMPTPAKRTRGKAGSAAAAASSSSSDAMEDIPAAAASSSSSSSSSSRPQIVVTGIDFPSIFGAGVDPAKMIKSLGGSLVDDIASCTHLVCDRVRRTEKFLIAYSRVQNILHYSWLKESAEKGKFLDESKYQLTDPENEAKYGFKLKSRKVIGSDDDDGEDGCLATYSLYFTKNVKPAPKPVMENIVKSAGGKFLTRAPSSFSHQTLVISCEEDENEPVYKKLYSLGYTIYSNELLLCGILRQKLDFAEPSYILAHKDPFI